MSFELTSENYYSDIANYEYMSVSQFKDFAGTYGKVGCEECAMAKIQGKFREPNKTALLEGSYVDAFYEEHWISSKRNTRKCSRRKEN